MDKEIHVSIPRKSFIQIHCPNCKESTSFDQALKIFYYPGGLFSAKPVICNVIVMRCIACKHEFDENAMKEQAKKAPAMT